MNENEKLVLDELEYLIDSSYSKSPLPHKIKTMATWYLSLVIEDMHMWTFRIRAAEQAFQMEDILKIDRLKYTFKYALSRISNELLLDYNVELPTNIDGTDYTKAQRIIESGLDHNIFIGAISSVYSKYCTLRKNAKGFEFEDTKRSAVENQYLMLQSLGYIPHNIYTHSIALLNLFSNKKYQPSIIEKIANSTSLKRKILRYKYNPELSIELSGSVSQQPFIAPPGWFFKWGNREETTLLLNSLAMRCIYHIIAIEFSARKYNLTGGGCESLLLITSRDELINDIFSLSNVNKEKIINFLDCLSYGHKTKNSDPSLQPIIKISGSRYLVPCFHIITSNLERNLLSLQARIDKVSFDAQSSLLESKMTKEIISIISKAWPINSTSKVYSASGTKEEIDLLLVDKSNKTILIGELRWLLPPGDPREVFHKIDACKEKITQLDRKLKWIEKNITTILEAYFDIKPYASEKWNIHGMVVVEGFSGIPSHIDGIFVMPKSIAEIGLCNFKNLHEFYKWGKSLSWLPQEDIHFEKIQGEYFVSGIPISRSGISPKIDPAEFYKFVNSTMSNNY